MSSDQVYTGVSNKVLSACPKLIKNQLTGLLDNMKKKVLCQARKFGGNWQLTSGREEVRSCKGILERKLPQALTGVQSSFPLRDPVGLSVAGNPRAIQSSNIPLVPDS